MRCSALCILACGLLVLAVTEARSTNLKTYLQHLKARQAPAPPCSEDKIEQEFEKCLIATNLEIPSELMEEFEEEEDEEDEDDEEDDDLEDEDIEFMCKIYEKNKGEKFGKFLECFKGQCASVANDIEKYLIPYCDFILRFLGLKKKHTEKKNMKLLKKVLQLLAARR